MNKGFIKALLPLFVLVFFTLPFVSCGGGDSSSSSSANGGSVLNLYWTDGIHEELMKL